MKTIEDLKRDISNVKTFYDLQYQIDVVNALKNVPEIISPNECVELDTHIAQTCAIKFPEVFKTWDDDYDGGTDYEQSYACAIEY